MKYHQITTPRKIIHFSLDPAFTTTTTTTTTTASSGCGSPQWQGDDYCDDDNNNAGCDWDGGNSCHWYSLYCGGKI